MVFGGETAESYYDDGLTASMKGDLARAVASLEQAIRLDRSLLPAFHLLGKCYARLGQYDRAVTILDHLVRDRPDQILARLDLGDALLRMGRAAQAERHFTQIAKLDPGNGRALLGLSRVRMEQGNWQGAVAMAQAAEQCSGPSIAVLLALGRAAKPAGALDVAERALLEAETLLEKSNELTPDRPEGYYLRGEVNFLLNKAGSALEQFREAAARTEEGRLYTAFGETFTFPDVLAKQGLCLERLGRTDQARALGERIAGIDPDHRIGRALQNL